MLAVLFSGNKWNVMLVMTDYAKTYASTTYQSLRAAVHMRTITVMQIKLLLLVVVAQKHDLLCGNTLYRQALHSQLIFNWTKLPPAGVVPAPVVAAVMGPCVAPAPSTISTFMFSEVLPFTIFPFPLIFMLDCARNRSNQGIQSQSALLSVC